MSNLCNVILERLLQKEDLTEVQSEELLRKITGGSLPDELIAGLLIALRAKGETPAEVRGFAKAMRALATRPEIPPGKPVVDIVGTGGDRSGSLNLSTGSALLLAACGVRVVKHGNRSVSSKSGSADVLEALAYKLPAGPAQAGQSLQATGFTFLFAPYFHPAMKSVAPARRALGVRTVFNILGPLTNPAEPPFMLLGAYSEAAADMMAQTLSGMKIERAFVVHGKPGWDEATPVGSFSIYDVAPGLVNRYDRDPIDYGIPRCKPEDLAGGDAATNAQRLQAVLSGKEKGPHRDALILGTALALEVCGECPELDDGIVRAGEALDSGKAARIVPALAKFSEHASS